ncbi:MAG TPA: hypothetical protein VH597_00405 [Verrucomicrobiae bacterium]|nr:hypothetical protein [Verrucomicrobiae bacterium]
MNRKLEVIPRIVAEKLEAHAQVIHTLIAAQRRGAAEQFGYAFLAGRALLQAKNIVPNGNANVPNAGFKRWVEASFPEITMRTAENWMFFAESIITRAQADAVNSPLLLGSVELTGQSHDSILQLVPEVMDGKGMMHFMRDCRLLRPPGPRPSLQPKPVPAHDEVKEKSAQARRTWEGTMTKLELSEKFLPHIEATEDLKRYLNAIVESGNKIRSFLKQRNKLEK